MSERVTFHLDEIIKDGEQGALWKWRGKCAVANGCFDGCHPGHLEIFAALDTEAYARRLRPIVAMNSDASIKMLKGSDRPFMPQLARATLINNLRWPLTVVVFDEMTPHRLMEFLQPAVVIKGQEYDPKTVVRWKDSEVLTIPMKDSWSTTNILRNTR